MLYGGFKTEITWLDELRQRLIKKETTWQRHFELLVTVFNTGLPF